MRIHGQEMKSRRSDTALPATMKRNAKHVKLFVVKKFIYANSATQAITKDKQTAVDEVYVDDEWKQKNVEMGNPLQGFKTKDSAKK